MARKRYEKTGISSQPGTAEYQREYRAKYRERLRENARTRLERMTDVERAEYFARREQRRKEREAEDPEMRRKRLQRENKLRQWAWEKTPEGRADRLQRMRVKNWALGLRMQLKQRAKRFRNGHPSTSGPIDVAPEITTQWIRDQFDRQGGRCFYTGIAFEIRPEKRWMRRPSIDRRDSSKGYTPDNTVLVLCAINYLKNDYAEVDVLALLEEIRNTRPNG